MQEKKCAVCGVTFTTEKPNQKYCSLSCRYEGCRQKRAKWNEAHKHYHAEYMRRYRTARKEAL